MWFGSRSPVSRECGGWQRHSRSGLFRPRPVRRLMAMALKRYFLRLTSWKGLGDPTAKHCYADIVCDGATEVESVAKDHEHLFSPDEARKWGRIWMERQRRREACCLIEGGPQFLDPQEVLVGPREYKRDVNRLYRQAEDVGWWEGDEAKMMELCKELHDLNARHEAR